MKNKKADGNIFWIIIGSVIALIVLWIFVGSLIGDIFVKKQIGFIGAQTDEVTTDCDSDGYTGLTDDCPCNPQIQNLDKDKVKTCGNSNPEAIKKCPSLCK